MKLQGNKNDMKGYLFMATEVSTVFYQSSVSTLVCFWELHYVIEIISFQDYSTKVGCDFVDRCLRLHHLFT
jgi:hypothetical protein